MGVLAMGAGPAPEPGLIKEGQPDVRNGSKADIRKGRIGPFVLGSCRDSNTKSI
jgi:hypothetical protein